MKFTKKALFGIAAAATFTASAALADYPEKPIKIMVGFLQVEALTQQLGVLHLTCMKRRA